MQLRAVREAPLLRIINDCRQGGSRFGGPAGDYGQTPFHFPEKRFRGFAVVSAYHQTVVAQNEDICFWSVD